MMSRSGSGEGPVVEAVGLVKVFSDFWMRARARAVDGISFEIRPHEVFGLLGPNGSGKSTTIKLILGLLHKSKGKLAIYGRDPGDVAVKARIGFLPEESYLYRFLNARETLDYYAKLFGLDRRTRLRRADELLDMVGLSGSAHRAVGEYSKGMARRLGLAQALVNDPEFLILDEPTSGLDPIGTRQVKDLLLELRRRGKTILLSSHLLADVEDVCDRMVILYGGKIRAEGTAQSLLCDTEHTLIRTRRLSESTVARIDQVLHESEGAGIESVQAPRQRLEELFMRIVDEARTEQAQTSGATHGGQVAQFLSGDSAEGGDLIRDLQSEAPSPRRATAPTASVAPSQPTAGADEIATLTQPAATAAPPGPSAPLPTSQVAATDKDDSFIEGLIDRSPSERRPPAPPGGRDGA